MGASSWGSSAAGIWCRLSPVPTDVRQPAENPPPRRRDLSRSRLCTIEAATTEPRRPSLGGVPEWPNGAVSKTVVRTAYRGFESHPLRHSPIPSIPMSALKTDVGLSVARLNAAKVYEANLPRRCAGRPEADTDREAGNGRTRPAAHSHNSPMVRGTRLLRRQRGGGSAERRPSAHAAPVGRSAAKARLSETSRD